MHSQKEAVYSKDSLTKIKIVNPVCLFFGDFFLLIAFSSHVVFVLYPYIIPF